MGRLWRPPRATTIPPEQLGGPQRTCVGCRTTRCQGDLVRIVQLCDGSLAVGRTLPGRGAWLCRGDADCLDLAGRRNGFTRSFRAPVSALAVVELRSIVAAHHGS